MLTIIQSIAKTIILYSEVISVHLGHGGQKLYPVVKKQMYTLYFNNNLFIETVEFTTC